MLAEAIKTAGSTDKDAIVKALSEIDFKGVAGEVRYDGSGDPIKSVTIIQVVDGEYTFFDKVNP